MRTISRQKKLAVVSIATIAVLGTGTAAYAYWTTTGSGSGTGSVRAENGTVVLNGTVDEPLAPGESSPVHFTAGNASTSDLYVGTIHAVVSTNKAGCAVTDFTLPDVAANQVIPAGAIARPITSTGTLTFANTAANQDACKGAEITLTLTSN